jgi:sporulation protein YlmC with PRC-barrel domain
MTHLTRKTLLGTAAAALMISSAFAQSTPTPSSPSSTPSAPSAAPSTSSGSSGTGQMNSGSMASGSMNFVTTQRPEQYLASKFTGTDVIGTDNAKIGDVSDMLFDKDGKIEAYVISVGGFLGVGAKDVAIAPSAFEVVKGTNGESDKLKLSATKDQLKQAQNFQPYSAPSTTTGAGNSGAGSMGSRPATAPATGR